MSGIQEYITEMFQNSGNQGLFWLVVCISIIVVILLVWLILRKVRLWYWKVNLQVDALQDINGKLNRLEEKITEQNFEIEVPAFLSEDSDMLEPIDLQEDGEISIMDDMTDEPDETGFASVLVAIGELDKSESTEFGEPDELTDMQEAVDLIKKDKITIPSVAQTAKKNEEVPNLGKSKTGRVYTEEELEALIKD